MAVFRIGRSTLGTDTLGSSQAGTTQPVTVDESVLMVIPPILDVYGSQIVMPGITLNGSPLNSNVPDTNGVVWVLQALEGWDAPVMRETSMNRARQHGTFNDPVYYGHRLITAKGHFGALTAQVAMAARERLHALVDITDTLVPLIVSEVPPKMIMVRRTSGYKDRPVAPSIFEFEVHLLAPDPRKYDPTLTTKSTGLPSGAVGGFTWPVTWPIAWGTQTPGGFMTVVNNGTTITYPVLTIAGPCTNPQVGNQTSGQTLAFLLSLSTGDLLTIDLRTRAVVLNNSVSRRGSIISTPDQWWGLAPGSNVIQFRSSDTTNTGATLSVASASAWI